MPSNSLIVIDPGPSQHSGSDPAFQANAATGTRLKVLPVSPSKSKKGGRKPTKLYRKATVGWSIERYTSSPSLRRIALVSKMPIQLAATVVEMASNLGRMLTMTTTQPDTLSAVRYLKPGRLQVKFADGRSFPLPVKRLEMPVNEINWTTAAASPDGTAMTVRDLQGIEIPISSGAIRCMVDKVFAARAKAEVDALRLTREQLGALSEVSERPVTWDDEPTQAVND